jgi:Ribonuclease G/E
MSGNLLVINVDIREIRVALIEDGVIAELHIERLSSRNTFGNVYLGKVSRVLPGMQAAFIDIGEERAAFLHVEDLIRPDDFEAYLAGARLSQRDDATEEGADKADAEADVDAEAAEEEAEEDEVEAEEVEAEAAETMTSRARTRPRTPTRRRKSRRRRLTRTKPKRKTPMPTRPPPRSRLTTMRSKSTLSMT